MHSLDEQGHACAGYSISGFRRCLIDAEMQFELQKTVASPFLSIVMSPLLSEPHIPQHAMQEMQRASF
jgi:hypothetical protein